MTSPLMVKFLAGAALAAAVLGAASSVEAHPEARVTIGLPVPFFVEPPIVYAPEWRAPHRGDFERERAWRHGEWERREFERREFERREFERREWQRREWERHHRDRFVPDERGWH